MRNDVRKAGKDWETWNSRKVVACSCQLGKSGRLAAKNKDMTYQAKDKE
jgi:hypothetical protein